MIDFGAAPKVRHPVRILLVDDQVVFRVAVRALLERHRDLFVVGEAGRGEEAVARAETTRPDVVVMDLAMPGKGGIEATRQITRLGIGAKVLVLTALPQAHELLDALDAGASGFVEKTEAAEHLVSGIRAVAGGRLFLGPDAAKFVVLQRYQRQGQSEDEKVAEDRLSGRARG
jgi:DNA-binding NarL/FixJ family response regulator